MIIKQSNRSAFVQVMIRWNRSKKTRKDNPEGRKGL